MLFFRHISVMFKRCFKIKVKDPDTHGLRYTSGGAQVHCLWFSVPHSLFQARGLNFSALGLLSHVLYISDVMSPDRSMHIRV